MELITEIRITGSSPWFSPLSLYSDFTFIFTHNTFSNDFAGFTKFSGNFRSAVIVFGIIIYFLDFCFDSIFPLLLGREFPVKDRPVTRA